MQLTLNGEDTTLRDGVTIGDLLADLELTKRRVAVEVNRDIVRREAFAARVLSDGDIVEIVHFIGGG